MGTAGFTNGWDSDASLPWSGQKVMPPRARRATTTAATTQGPQFRVGITLPIGRPRPPWYRWP